MATTTDSDILSQGEAESSSLLHPPPNPNNLRSIGRQLSIYSLTLDEFQNTFSDSNGGKPFGSMNMDEFLNSIWSAEEHHHNHHHHNPQFVDTLIPPPPAEPPYPLHHFPQISNSNNHNHNVTISKQPSIPRQGSFTIPEPLCRKTVEEVWSEIQKGRHGAATARAPQKQPTFGEMTLEDFLVCAGVVRDHNLGSNLHVPAPPPPQAYAIRPFPVPGYVSYNPKTAGMSYGGRIGNSSGGNNNLGSPASPAADGLCTDDGYGGGGLESRGSGRKRSGEGPVEKVVERRQRRMIKNRESAARSRARKQAYTVELEAELNQLREENLHLKQALAESERRQKQMYYEEVRGRVEAETRKGKERPVCAMKRSSSCVY